MPTTVNVILPTFNGEKFLKTLLESIKSQESVKVEIWARDDGSTDRTVEILESYDGPIKIIKDGLGNLGVVENIKKILESTDSSNFLAFADQDDVWDPNHLINGILILRESELESKPMLYFPRYSLINSKNEMIGLVPSSKNLSTGNALIQNPVIGCGVILNEFATAILKEIELSDTTFIDWQLYFLFSLHSGVVQGEYLGVNYRLHGENLVGIPANGFSRFKTISKISKSYKEAWISFDFLLKQLQIKQTLNIYAKDLLMLENLDRGVLYKTRLLCNFGLLGQGNYLRKILFTLLFIFGDFKQSKLPLD
jgi:rhamnosyltransferase